MYGLYLKDREDDNVYEPMFDIIAKKNKVANIIEKKSEPEKVKQMDEDFRSFKLY